MIRLITFLAFLTISSTAGAGCLDLVKNDLRAQWPANSTVNIVAFGHSVPAGYFDTPNVHTREAYPRQLADGLAALYPHAVINVITSAVGGQNSTQGASRFGREALSYHPRVILIDYGLNDRGIPISKARSNLENMVHEAKAAGSCVILLTPSPDLAGNPPGSKSTLEQQESMIRALAAAEDVPVADSAKAFSGWKGKPYSLMAIPNHPNMAGHKLIAGKLLELFR